LRNFKDVKWKEEVTKVVQEVQEKQIKYVKLQFTDINGIIKSVTISSKE
jgi:glutamine synthetase